MLVNALLSLALTAGLTPLVLVGLRHLDVLDRPSPRGSHDRPTLRGGGLAPAVALLSVLMIRSPVTGGSRLVLAVTTAAFALIGLAEDLWGVRALRRLALHAMAAGLAVPWALTTVDGAVARLFLGVVVLVWLVGSVNAFNFMDGINGISCAQVAVAGVAWYLIGRSHHAPGLAALGLVAAMAALGFAPFNFPRARLFLGDVGSYFLGAWLAVAAVVGIKEGLPIEAVLAPLSLYAADTGITLLRRCMRRERWWEPHRDHVYQRLAADESARAATTVAVGAAIAACSAFGALSLTGSPVLRVAGDAAVLTVVAGYLLSPGRVELGSDRSAVAP